jgi:peroxiredoxin
VILLFAERALMLAVLGILLAVSFFLPVAAQSSLVGTEASDFTLRDLDGKEVSLKSLRGHVVVLHFWATYWESCYADMAYLDRVHRELKYQTLTILGINVGQLPRVIRGFIRKRGYTYPQLVNARGEVSR